MKPLEKLTPLLISSAGASRLLGIGKSLFYQLASNGELGIEPVKLNSKKLYSVKELSAWVDAKCPSREKWQRTVDGVNVEANSVNQ